MRHRLLLLVASFMMTSFLLGVNFFLLLVTHTLCTMVEDLAAVRGFTLVRPPLILPIPSFIKILLYDSYYYESSLLLIANDSLMSYSEYYSLESSSDSSLCENVFLTNIFSEEKSKCSKPNSMIKNSKRMSDCA